MRDAATIVEDRLAKVQGLKLDKGSHQPPNGQIQACVMEAVAYVAGEPWSASPKCACPVLTSFMVAWNDSLDDKDRQKLKPYIERLVGTRSTEAVEKQRSYMAVDWLIRTFAPARLSKAGLRKHAKALRDLPELTTLELVNQAEPIISAAISAAYSAAYSALQPTMRRLQRSAFDLLDRMIAVSA